jgi:transcriptional regulator with XRE-family HTH domain
MGLTQRELADLSSLSIRAIRDIEADRVRIPRPDTVRLLSEALRIDEAALTQYIDGPGPAGLPLDPALEPRRTAVAGAPERAYPVPGDPATGLQPPPPAPDGIIGRGEETRLLTTRLLEDRQRLVTVSGISGVGKTRLAIEAARLVSRQAGGRVAWLPAAGPGELQTTGQPWPRYRAESWPGVSTAPCPAGDGAEGLTPHLTRGADGGLGRLIGHIGDEPMLLVVDGVTGGQDGIADGLAELMHNCPGLSVLYAGTSPLELPGEWVLPLPPLELPPPSAETHPSDLSQSPSVRLLLTHLLQVWPAFRLNPANGPVIAEICRLVDGLPHALAHAASAFLLDSPAGVRDQASRDPLSVSSPFAEDSRDLRQMLRQDMGTLEPELRDLLSRLARIEGDWTVEEAASQIGAEVQDVAQLVYVLVKRGMVRTTERHHQPRFCLLNLIRALFS